MGAATLIIGLPVVLALAAAAAVAVRRRALAQRPDAAESARGKACAFCLSSVSVDGRFATLTRSSARETLGAAPPERSAFTDPQGEERFLTHIECLRDAQKEVCLFCREGILPGEKMAFLERPYARKLLGSEPPERSAGVNPQGEACFFGHEECTHDAMRVVCMYCLKDMMPGDTTVGFEKPYARELLGAEPSERSVTTEPGGKACHVAHAECVRAAGVDLSGARRYD